MCIVWKTADVLGVEYQTLTHIQVQFHCVGLLASEFVYDLFGESGFEQPSIIP